MPGAGAIHSINGASTGNFTQIVLGLLRHSMMVLKLRLTRYAG
ncbi:hypothetical protein PANO111632_20665 [Paracoccus nototheniae]